MTTNSRLQPHDPMNSPSDKKPPFLWIAVLPGIVFFILFLAPNDVLDQWAWTRAYTDMTLQIFPFMKRHAPHSPHAQVLQLGAAFFIVCIWIQVLMLVIWVARNAKEIFRRLLVFGGDKWGKPIVTSLFGVVATTHYLLTRDEPDFSKVQIKAEMSRFMTAFTEAAFLFLLPSMLFLLLAALYGLFTRSRRRN